MLVFSGFSWLWIRFREEGSASPPETLLESLVNVSLVVAAALVVTLTAGPSYPSNPYDRSPYSTPRVPRSPGLEVEGRRTVGGTPHPCLFFSQTSPPTVATHGALHCFQRMGSRHSGFCIRYGHMSKNTLSQLRTAMSTSSCDLSIQTWLVSIPVCTSSVRRPCAILIGKPSRDSDSHCARVL